MGNRTGAAVLALLCLLAAADARAQSADHDDVEVIAPPKEPPPKAQADTQKVAALIVEQTNAFRKEQKRSTVEVSRELTRAARYFADYMAEKDRYGHTADGNRPADRAKKHGYEYCIVLENIAYQYSSKDFESAALTGAFVEGWKESPGHRRNMLDADVTQTGVAVARSDRSGYYYAVQMFGRPRSRSIEFQISNRTESEVKYRLGEQTYRLGPRYTRTHTRCRPPELTFDPPGKEGGRKTLWPAAGDRLVVTGEGESVRIKKE